MLHSGPYPVVRLLGKVNSERFGIHLAAACAAQGAIIARSELPDAMAEAGAAQWALESPVDPYPLLRELLPWTRNEGAIVLFSRSARPVRAFLFDLDATLTTCEFLDTLADELGLGAQTRELTRAAMNGTMDFATSYRTRLQLLAGTPIERIDAVIARLQLTKGAETLCETLRRHAIPAAIVTGGYARVGRVIAGLLGIENLYATELEEKDGVLTGRPIGEPLDEAAKVRALDDFCAKKGCRRTDCAAVGDGANDLRMLAAAEHAVLYSSQPDNPSQRQSIHRILDFLQLAETK